MKKAYVLDYECGNVKSVIKAFEFNNYSISKGKFDNISPDSLLIIPGVGNFGYAMNYLNKNNLVKLIKNHYILGGQILGICLGMQLLFEGSEEAPGIQGLGLIKGKVKKLKNFDSLNFSNMHLGWSNTNFKGLNQIHDMYYVHQYYCEPDSDLIITETFKWRNEEICAGIKTNQIRAFQFHPEKSSKTGLKLIDNL